MQHIPYPSSIFHAPQSSSNLLYSFTVLRPKTIQNHPKPNLPTSRFVRLRILGRQALVEKPMHCHLGQRTIVEVRRTRFRLGCPELEDVSME